MKNNIRQSIIAWSNRFPLDRWWRKKYNIDIEVLNDGSNDPEDRRGAVGDIKFAIHKDTCDWLVLGGDNLFEND